MRKRKRKRKKKLFYNLFEKRALALHDGITEKIDSLPRYACGVIIVSNSGRSGL
jgi:hypothetical protein